MAFEHVSVLLHETVDGLNVKPDGIYVDATLGGGGHAYEVCTKLGEQGRLIGIDQDADAIKAAGKRLEGFGEKVTIIRSNYCDMKPRLHEIGIDKVDGITVDLGVSSYQLDTAERGFSYRVDAPLDMRMDQRQKMTARDIVNDYSESELYRVIRDYGEDRFAKNIAKHIVAERTKGPIETTGQLNEIISHAIPMKIQKTSGHPSKRTFQALRIELNHELDVLRDTLDDMIDLLNPGGRLCIITFHSLEDRIVKSSFRKNENPCICPSHFPVCVCGNVSKGKVITRKPILPSEEELPVNSREYLEYKRNVPPGRGEPGGTRIQRKDRKAMARNTGRRQQNRPAADWNHFYVYGSAVRQPEALPSGNGTVRKPKKKRTSRQVIKNRHRAQRISPAYATFLIAAAVCAVFICVMYLRLHQMILHIRKQKILLILRLFVKRQ